MTVHHAQYEYIDDKLFFCIENSRYIEILSTQILEYVAQLNGRNPSPMLLEARSLLLHELEHSYSSL